MNRKAKKSKDNSQDLYNQLTLGSSNKKKLKAQLKSSLKPNTIIKKSQSATILPTIQKQTQKLPERRILKEQSLLQLSRSLNERIQVDRSAKVRINQMGEEFAAKRRKIEHKIEEIRKRNMSRMKQLNDFQQRYIKKMTAQYQRDKQIQQGLMEEYQFLLKQEGKTKQTNAFREIIEAEDWQQILKQKKKLQLKMRQYARKQQNLLREQNPETAQKIKQIAQKKLQQEKAMALAVSNLQKSSMPKVKVDAKQIGNQYLQYAKKVKQLPKDKSKIRMLDVNLKSIDYTTDIINKIARNTGDLSRYRIEQTNAFSTKGANSNKQKIGFKALMPEVKQDEQTKKYLKQIKKNLNELSNNNKNK